MTKVNNIKSGDVYKIDTEGDAAVYYLHKRPFLSSTNNGLEGNDDSNSIYPKDEFVIIEVVKAPTPNNATGWFYYSFNVMVLGKENLIVGWIVKAIGPKENLINSFSFWQKQNETQVSYV